MGRPRTSRFGESLPKCRHADTANLLRREGGEEKPPAPKTIEKKIPLNQLLLFKSAGSLHTAEEPIQTDFKILLTKKGATDQPTMYLFHT